MLNSKALGLIVSEKKSFKDITATNFSSEAGPFEAGVII